MAIYEGTGADDVIWAVDGESNQVFGLGGDDRIETGSGDDVVDGGDGDDTITAGSGNDLITGGLGSDTLNGGSGDDVIVVNGFDVINGGSGVDTIDLSALTQGVFVEFVATASSPSVVAVNDTSSGTSRPGQVLAQTIQVESAIGTAFDDVLHADESDDAVDIVIDGGGGDDVIRVGGGDDVIRGGAGDDQLFSLGGTDALYGGDGDDELFAGGSGAGDSLDGGDGADQLHGSTYADVFIGGLGIDTVFYGGAVAVNINLATGAHSGAAAGDTYYGIERFSLSSGDDVFTGRERADYVLAGDGSDTLNGGGGADTLAGQNGTDILNGGDGADELLGGAGADVLNGGAGTDYASYRGARAAVRINLSIGSHQGEAQGDTFTSIERFLLSGYDDFFTGSTGNDWAEGGNGNDNLSGGDGVDLLFGDANNDQLFGAAGNDTLAGGLGNDALDGGAGRDAASYERAATAVTINLTSGVHTGEAAGDTFVSIEQFRLTAFADNFVGSSANDFAEGNGGNDALSGGAGNDFFFGGAGADVIDGGTGRDTLFGGAGDDTLTGGADADRFAIDAGAFGADTITDFENGVDFIRVLASAQGAVGDDFSDLSISSNGSGWAVITFQDGSTMTLTGVTAAQIDASDFLFD